ncbi:MAG: hypothetical protein GY906_03395 [bacterium]|nr:hypothetical protein [bacterium]
MRSFHLRPTIVATAVFLILANVVLLVVAPEGSKVESPPDEEIWFVYYAVVYGGDPPEGADDAWLRTTLSRFDDEAEEVASRLRVLGCELDENGFALRVQHLGNERTYTLRRYGIE